MSRRSPAWRLLPGVVRVLAMATVFAPLVASGQELPPTFPPLNGPQTFDALPFPGSVDPLPPQSSPIGVPPVCYWTVSSRGLPQESVSCGSEELGYYARLQDGSLLPTSREAMISELVPGVPICIFIHGSFVDSASHKLESAHTYNWIRNAAPHLPVHIIFYTWPSEARVNSLASANPVAVNQRGRWADNNAFYLADLLSHLPDDSPICFVGHSHGARVAAATLHLVSGGQIEGRAFPYDTGCRRRYRAVFAAAALDRHWLNPGERYDFAVRRTEGILNMVNRTDGALHFYPLREPFSRKAIAVTGLTLWDRHRLGPLACKVIDYDVTPLMGLGHFWPHYFAEPSLARAISPYVYFTDTHYPPAATDVSGEPVSGE